MKRLKPIGKRKTNLMKPITTKLRNDNEERGRKLPEAADAHAKRNTRDQKYE